MSAALASLGHRGPKAAARVLWGRGDLRPVSGVMRRGETLCAGVGRIFAEAGCRGGVVSFDGLRCDPLFYVGPAVSQDPAYAAYYSERFAGDGDAPIRSSTATVGLRDGEAFFHCHGEWQAGGRPVMGHILPHDCIVAEDCVISGLGSAGNAFAARYDAETNFTLFHPETEERGQTGGLTGGQAGGQSGGIFLRVAPDRDLVEAIAEVAAEAGIRHARIHGVGSICEPHFVDQGRIATPITEMRIDQGLIRDGAVSLAVSYVDTDWRIHRGTLVGGRNPVGVTFEILIEDLAEAATRDGGA